MNNLRAGATDDISEYGFGEEGEPRFRSEYFFFEFIDALL
jgi:hypothetical protein